MVVAAFFLIWGYFSIHQVVFRPWGLQNTKNSFYKKILCDQASDAINSESLPTMHHQPPATPILLLQNRPVVNSQGGDQPCRPLAMALVPTTLPSRAAGGIDVSGQQEQDQLLGKRRWCWITRLPVRRGTQADY